MAKPVTGYMGYDVAADRPLVKLVAGTKKLRTEDDMAADEIVETGGPTTLSVGSIPALTLLRRGSSDNIEGCVPGDFTHQTSPASSMKIPIDDGGVIKYCTIGELLALVGAVSGSTGNPFTDPPASANAFDDEFNSGSTDLATRGYTVKTSAGTTLTRSGDINPWDATGPTGNTYWSTIIGSWMFIQPPASVTLWVYKSITLSVGDTYFARTGGAYRYDSAAAGRFQEVGFFASTAGNPDVNNRVYCSVYETNGAVVQMDMFRVLAGAGAGSSRNNWHPSDIHGLRYHTSTNQYNIFAVNGANGQSVTFSSTGGPAATALVFFVVSTTSGAAGSTPTLLCVDFIRKKTSNAWIVP